MHTNILWAGQEYNSLENCLLTYTNKAIEIRSVIIGFYKAKIFKVDYLIKTNGNWETVFVEVKTQLDHTVKTTSLKSDGKGNWTMNGKPQKRFSGCTDVDISLTPFTNSLPINRLNFNGQKSRRIKVIYFDVFAQKVKPVFQNYTKKSKTRYKFENVPNDFEALVKVDEQGLVVDYPGLFKRISKR